MEELRFPWNNREGLLYGGVIALITSFLMMTFNICKNKGGVELEYICNSIVALPFVWVAVMLIMSFVVGRIANWFLNRYMQPSDSANTRIVLNIVACVTCMSIIMTIVGPLVGSIPELTINLEGLYHWPVNWPVNFCVAFWIEMLIAQPTARSIMKRKHIRAIKRTKGAAASE